MFRYVYFLNRTMIKKKSLWITTIVGLLAFSILAYMEIKSANNVSYNQILGSAKVNNWLTFDYFIPFLFGTLVTAFIVIHCFKDGESDGTELIIVAKPLTRSQIIFGKFISTLGALVIYHILCLIVYMIIGSFDQVATPNEKITFAFSFAIGGFIVQLFVVGIITLLASLFEKVGTLVTAILFAAVLPIASFIIAPLTGAYGTSDYTHSAKHPTNIIKSYVKETGKFITVPVNIIDTNDLEGMDNAEKKNKYKTISKFDPWYQWGRFYNVFINAPKVKNVGMAGNMKNDHAKKLELMNDPKYSDIKIIDVVIDNELQEFILVRGDIEHYNENGTEFIPPTHNSLSIKKYADNFMSLNWIDLLKESNIQDNFLERYANIEKNDFITEFNRTSWSQRIELLGWWFRTNYKSNANMVNPQNEMSILILQHITNDWIDQAGNKTVIGNFDTEARVKYLNNIRKANNLYELETTDYMKTSTVVIIWSIIGVILLGLSSWVYAKRDFK
ncbi:ABC transporter permease [Candidatus Mycoplasma mahonii]|uniref:ABC transporter permease n=1 Tax=Candidatus Mycoplasma mahonii TaxID=3004105 RepID=UPI0026EABBE2|nr:ABC transporter permease [Candidatus Mycoplasma mahonii]WKX02231.1 ABC transporter permease [Candidatus Mycoplasma mahonii]